MKNQTKVSPKNEVSFNKKISEISNIYSVPTMYSTLSG